MHKVFGKIGLWLALSIMLAHNFTPHGHHKPDERVCHSVECNEEGLLEFFKDVFHNDLGSEHLEVFQASQWNPLPLLFVILPDRTWDVNVQMAADPVPDFFRVPSVIEVGPIRSDRKRGPPYFV